MKTQLPNDVTPNPPLGTRKPSKAQMPMIKQTILKFSKSIVCRLIKFNEHLEQGTITEAQPQEPKETQAKEAVSLRRLLAVAPKNDLRNSLAKIRQKYEDAFVLGHYDEVTKWTS